MEYLMLFYGKNSYTNRPQCYVIRTMSGLLNTNGTRLEDCATSRKVAGSIPDGIIKFFHWYNSSGRTMALGSTQPLTEMSTRDVSWG